MIETACKDVGDCLQVKEGPFHTVVRRDRRTGCEIRKE
jgi:hypothetical protein